MKKTLPTRRAFLRTAAAAAAVPALGFPAVVKLRRPNELLSHASIGTGNMARRHERPAQPSRPPRHGALRRRRELPRPGEAPLPRRARLPQRLRDVREGGGGARLRERLHPRPHACPVRPGGAAARAQRLRPEAPLPCARRLRPHRAPRRREGAVTQMGTQIAAWECDRKTVAALRRGLVGEVRRVWLFRRAAMSRAPPTSPGRCGRTPFPRRSTGRSGWAPPRRVRTRPASTTPARGASGATSARPGSATSRSIS